MPPQTPVGLIGVGLMGEVYAARLIAAGFGVIGFDVDPARMKRLVNSAAAPDRWPRLGNNAIQSLLRCSRPIRWKTS